MESPFYQSKKNPKYVSSWQDYSPDILTDGFDTVQRRPPSTGKMAPVVKDAASEARNKMALDTSSTVPTRPRGCAAPFLAQNYKIQIMYFSLLLMGIP